MVKGCAIHMTLQIGAKAVNQVSQSLYLLHKHSKVQLKHFFWIIDLFFLKKETEELLFERVVKIVGLI